MVIEYSINDNLHVSLSSTKLKIIFDKAIFKKKIALFYHNISNFHI